MTVFDMLDKKITEHMKSFITVVLDGTKDFVEYKELCGVLRGLRLAQSEVLDLAQRYKEEEDE